MRYGTQHLFIHAALFSNVVGGHGVYGSNALLCIDLCVLRSSAVPPAPVVQLVSLKAVSFMKTAGWD